MSKIRLSRGPSILSTFQPATLKKAGNILWPGDEGPGYYYGHAAFPLCHWHYK